MITAGDLRKGVTFEMEGKIYIVVDFLHVKPGKGAAFVRTKLKNVETGQVVEKTFRAGEKVAKATLDTAPKVQKLLDIEREMENKIIQKERNKERWKKLI